MTARSCSRRLLFEDDDDSKTYLALLSAQVERCEWDVFNFCLMGNHLHLLLRTPEPNLGVGIKVAHERFARYVNRRREEHGHLFGDRFYNGIVVQQRHFEACMRYITRNPVAAGLCTRAEDWRWSAHRALTGAAESPGFLDIDAAFGLIHESRDAARASYESWVAQPDVAVLATLEARVDDDSWLISAVDGHRIADEDIMEFKGWSRRTLQRRLRAARVAEGAVP